MDGMKREGKIGCLNLGSFHTVVGAGASYAAEVTNHVIYLAMATRSQRRVANHTGALSGFY